jgi:hypothetical protein
MTMMKMMKVNAAKNIASPATTSRRRCPVHAPRPGSCIFVLVRQMSRPEASPAPRREKRSGQTIYDAATREVLQIDFPSRGERSFWKTWCRSAQNSIQNAKWERKGSARNRERAHAGRLFPAEQIRDLTRN